MARSFARPVAPYGSPRTSFAYRGYYVTFNPLRDEYSISKEGHHISYATSPDDAKSKIDEIA